MFDVFISYSTKNIDAAQEVCRCLEAAGSTCWMAPRDLLPGIHWAASITQAIRNARVLVLMFSLSANESTQVVKEVNLANECRVPIITVMLEQVETNDDLTYYLSATQRFTAVGDLQATANTLIDIVHRVLHEKQPKTPAPSHAGPLLDIYDSEMDWAGTALRNQAHKLGLWHKTFHCWFYGNFGANPVLYVQKRSQHKADFPGMLDITVGRHLLANETDREAVEKMRLELGVDVAFEDLHYLGVRTYTEHIGNFFNNEFNSVYLYESLFELNDFAPNPDEVSGVLRLDAAAALALFEMRRDQIDAIGLCINGARHIQKQPIRREDFVPRSDDYYQKICASVIAIATGTGEVGL